MLARSEPGQILQSEKGVPVVLVQPNVHKEVGMLVRGALGLIVLLEDGPLEQDEKGVFDEPARGALVQGAPALPGAMQQIEVELSKPVASPAADSPVAGERSATPRGGAAAKTGAAALGAVVPVEAGAADTSRAGAGARSAMLDAQVIVGEGSSLAGRSMTMETFAKTLASRGSSGGGTLPSARSKSAGPMGAQTGASGTSAMAAGAARMTASGPLPSGATICAASGPKTGSTSPTTTTISVPRAATGSTRDAKNTTKRHASSGEGEGGVIVQGKGEDEEKR